MPLTNVVYYFCVVMSYCLMLSLLNPKEFLYYYSFLYYSCKAALVSMIFFFFKFGKGFLLLLLLENSFVGYRILDWEYFLLAQWIFHPTWSPLILMRSRLLTLLCLSCCDGSLFSSLKIFFICLMVSNLTTTCLCVNVFDFYVTWSLLSLYNA